MKFLTVLALILGTSYLDFNQVTFYHLFFYLQELASQSLKIVPSLVVEGSKLRDHTGAIGDLHSSPMPVGISWAQRAGTSSVIKKKKDFALTP